MIALISPAKNMVSIEHNVDSRCSAPRFMEHTRHIVAKMLDYNAEELAEIFKISIPIARKLKSRFIDLLSEDQLGAAIDSYDGVVYKHFKEGLSVIDRSYLQSHMRISSLLYGLLRPLDLIKPYRMEGFVRLSGSDERVDKFWRDIQTQTLISDVDAAGGTLIYLASKEEQNAFHWKDVRRAVRVIDIQFLQHKGNKLRQVVVYTKMARGEMIRFMAQDNIDDPEQLKEFEWSGYRFRSDLSTADTWVWVME